MDALREMAGIGSLVAYLDRADERLIARAGGRWNVVQRPCGGGSKGVSPRVVARLFPTRREGCATPHAD